MASFDFISCRKEEVVRVRQSIPLKCFDTVQRTNLLAQTYARPDLLRLRDVFWILQSKDRFSTNKFQFTIAWKFPSIYRSFFQDTKSAAVCLSIVVSKNLSIRLENLFRCAILLHFRFFSPCHRARLSYFANLHRIPKIRDMYIARYRSSFFFFFLSFFARHTDYSDSIVRNTICNVYSADKGLAINL